MAVPVKELQNLDKNFNARKAFELHSTSECRDNSKISASLSINRKGAQKIIGACGQDQPDFYIGETLFIYYSAPYPDRIINGPSEYYEDYEDINVDLDNTDYIDETDLPDPDYYDDDDEDYDDEDHNGSELV